MTSHPDAHFLRTLVQLTPSSYYISPSSPLLFTHITALDNHTTETVIFVQNKKSVEMEIHIIGWTDLCSTPIFLRTVRES